MEFVGNAEGDQLETRTLGLLSYFAEIAACRSLPAIGPSFRVESIVKVQGDNRPGQKPFPHPFPARMPIEVATAAVEGLTKPGDLVLDPMSGSGVVSKAALTLGRRAVALDIDPLAVLQGRALCSSMDPETFVVVATRIHDRASEIISNRAILETVWSAFDSEELRFLDYWFPRAHSDQLIALSLALDDLTGEPDWPVYATLISSLVISRGSGASRAMDLSRSRPHRVATKSPVSPFAMWPRQVAAFRRYYERSASGAGGARIDVGDARQIDLPDQSVDAIVTSPPYLNAIDYIRTSKFSLVFFGERLAHLRSIRSHSVGTEVGMGTGVLDPAFDAMVEKGVSDPKRRPLVRRYIHDMLAALNEAHRVLKPGAKALYVMGPSILSRREYDAARVLATMAKSVGFHPLGHGRRDICEARRSLPPPRRSARGESINQRMSCEFYVVLSKAE